MLNLFIVITTIAKEAKHSGFVLKCFSLWLPFCFMDNIYEFHIDTNLLTSWQFHLSVFQDNFQRGFLIAIKFFKLTLTRLLCYLGPS